MRYGNEKHKEAMEETKRLILDSFRLNKLAKEICEKEKNFNKKEEVYRTTLHEKNERIKSLEEGLREIDKLDANGEYAGGYYLCKSIVAKLLKPKQ